MSRESISARDMRQRTNEELRELVTQLQDEMLRARISQATSALSDPSTIRKVRRDIARAKTILRLRELGKEIGPGDESEAEG